MTPADAAKLLELSADATPEQIETRFLDLRRKLEDRIAKAPTTGLQAKYRESLAQFTTAFETLTMAADSSLLPVLAKHDPQPAPDAKAAAPTAPLSAASAPATRAATPAATARKKSGGMEFVLVFIVALLLLVGGGWWVMNTRAENAERTRLAAVQKAEAERAADEEKRVAEEKRLADEAEKARFAAAEKAEQARKDALTAELRTRLAESRILWESAAKEERNVERALNDYRGEARNLQRDGPAIKYNELVGRVTATQRYLSWLAPYLERHPAQITRAKIEELLSSRMPDQALELMPQLQQEETELQTAIASGRESLEHLEGTLHVQTMPSGLQVEIVDGFGHRHQGVSPYHLATICPGPATITAKRPGYQDVSVSVTVQTGQSVVGNVEVVSETLTLTAEDDVEFWSNNVFISRGRLTMANYAPDNYAVELRRQGFRSFRTTVAIAQGKATRTVNFNFAAMSAQKHTCHNCNGTGRLETARECGSCGGDGRLRCNLCGGDGVFAYVNGQTIWCTACGRDGIVQCSSCRGSGEYINHITCQKCGGDGLLSDIDLAQN